MFFRLLLGGGILAVLLAGTTFAQNAPGKFDKLRVYIGTYTGPKSKGIYRCELDLAAGKLTEPQLAATVTSPSFLAIHPNQQYLYSVNEISNLAGKKMGGITAFAIDAKTGDLTQLNQEGSGGAGPCHLSVDRAGKNVLAANYGGGSVCVAPIDADGKLRSLSSFIQHKGSSVDKSRQEAPHAHSVNVDANNRFAFVCDLGLDKVLSYKLDADQGKLTPNDPPAVDMAPGAGPRHFAFHPDGKAAYAINEMNCTITAMDYDAERGVLTKRQSVPTTPDGVKKGYSTAEVQVHPSGRFVYGSNRGQNSIAIFKVDTSTHELTPAGHQGHHVKTPRAFGIDPTGAFLIVANQDGHSLVVFRIDQATGALTPTDSEIQVGSPVCVKFLPLTR
jgi:6-phosphogluconolactonase